VAISDSILAEIATATAPSFSACSITSFENALPPAAEPSSDIADIEHGLGSQKAEHAERPSSSVLRSRNRAGLPSRNSASAR